MHNRRLTALKLMIVTLFLLQVTGAYAVGAFFANKSEQSEVYSPGVRAFIHRDGVREDLILQIGFAGNASEFAWVVPVPSKPIVQAIDQAVFSELQNIFNPRILPPTQLGASPQPVEEKIPDPVSFIQAEIIPPMQPHSIGTWLVANGYQFSDQARQLIENYIKRGWYFIALKVKTTPQAEPRWLQPLWITFSSQRASFPALLSTLNSKPMMVQLYVATTVAVKAPGFVEVSTTGSPLGTKYKKGEMPNFFHVVTKDRILTELRATVDPKSINADIVIVPKE
ncbi:MAG TPA: DUF2330 domain-containing protein [Armatimonadota bacterium]|nr:DUF2330 domain-containing protein [Armatimonadota bacterium]